MLSRRLLSVSSSDNWYNGAYAAWQAKGAASLGASYLDLSGNGRNLTTGVAPSWASGTGWTFNGSTQYLVSTVTPALVTGYTVYTVFVRFSSYFGINTMLFGCGVVGISASDVWKFTPNVSGASVRFFNGGRTGVGSPITSGVMAMAGQTGYINGAFNVTVTGGSLASVYPIYIGAINTGGGAAEFANVTIEAIGIWDTTLNPTTVATKSTQMAAL